MAYRRSITARATIFYREQKLAPAFSHINHRQDDDINNSGTPFTGAPKVPVFLSNRSFTSRANSFSGSRFLYGDRKFPLTSHQFVSSMNCGSNFVRSMSTGAHEGGLSAAEYLGDTTADVLKDAASTTVGAVASQVDPLLSEVAVAATGSFPPVAALQYLIDYVHTFTGFQWWGAIIVTTLMIRLATSPLVINQMKATSKFTLLRPKLEAVKDEMQNRGMSPAAVAEGQEKMKRLMKEYGVTPFTPLKGLFIQGPIFVCFFLAITNMVEKVPSFKEGGAFWFTDLTTPDTMYILPVLTALTFWITVECNMQEGMEGNPAAGIVKNVSRGFAALTIPLTASFAKAIFCYWITSNVFSLFFGLVIKNPAIKKALGIPIIPVTPPTPGEKKPAFSFFEAIKKYAEAQAEINKQRAITAPAEASKPASQSVPSSSLINQRLRTLEREVKGRKKGKKK